MGEAGETPWPRGAHTGGAWLSSARVVRCWVKSRNERNPRRVLPSGDAGNPRGTAAVKAEEGGDDVKSSCPLCPGLHTCYNGRYRGMPPREGERIPESRPQFGLGAATRPHEVGVASNRGSALASVTGSACSCPMCNCFVSNPQFLESLISAIFFSSVSFLLSK